MFTHTDVCERVPVKRFLEWKPCLKHTYTHSVYLTWFIFSFGLHSHSAIAQTMVFFSQPANHPCYRVVLIRCVAYPLIDETKRSHQASSLHVHVQVNSCHQNSAAIIIINHQLLEPYHQGSTGSSDFAMRPIQITISGREIWPRGCSRVVHGQRISAYWTSRSGACRGHAKLMRTYQSGK